MDVNYRPATPLDTKIIYKLRLQLSKESKYMPYVPHELRELRKDFSLNVLAKKEFAIIANVDGIDVGYANAVLFKPWNKYIIATGVLAGYKNKGIGKKLLDLIVKEVKNNAKDFKSIGLFVDRDNLIAFKMYWKYGFFGNPDKDLYDCKGYPTLVYLELPKSKFNKI